MLCVGVDEFSSVTVHVEAKERECLPVGVEAQVRTRMILPLTSHLNLFDIEVRDEVVVDLQGRPIAYLQGRQGEVVAHLQHELDDKRLEAGQHVANQYRLTEYRIFAVLELDVQEVGKMDEFRPAWAWDFTVLE